MFINPFSHTSFLENKMRLYQSMKGSEQNKKAKVGIDKNLKKYVGKNIFEAKTEAFNESIEEIKIALSIHSKLRTQ